MSGHPVGSATARSSATTRSGNSAEYWDSPGRVGTLVGVLKAKVTGDRPDDGENETVPL